MGTKKKVTLLVHRSIQYILKLILFDRMKVNFIKYILDVFLQIHKFYSCFQSK